MTARWTADKIRRATLLPKPQGAIEQALAGPRPELEPLERRALRELIDNADLLDFPTPRVGEEIRRHDGKWLLVQVPDWLMALLESFESDREDDGHDGREPDVDDEPSEDDEPDDDAEEITKGEWRPDSVKRIRPSKPARPAIPVYGTAEEVGDYPTLGKFVRL